MRLSDFPIIHEIKDEYVQLRINKNSRAESVASLLSSYADELKFNDEDACLFWIALADAQYSMKELSAEIAEQGMKELGRLKLFSKPIAHRDISVREARYAQAPMPEKKKVYVPKRYRCSWNVGDTFAYRLSGPYAKEYGLDCKHILFRMVDTMEFGDGRLLPVVSMTLWTDVALPATSEKFQRVEPLRLSNGRLGTPKTLFEYRAEILFQNEKQIESMQLQYLGNFSDVPMPDDEVIITHPGMIHMLIPGYIDRDCCYFWNANQFFRQY